MIQFQMQMLELKITDLWDYLGIPQNFVDGWFLVKGVVLEYQESMRENG